MRRNLFVMVALFAACEGGSSWVGSQKDIHQVKDVSWLPSDTVGDGMALDPGQPGDGTSLEPGLADAPPADAESKDGPSDGPGEGHLSDQGVSEVSGQDGAELSDQDGQQDQSGHEDQDGTEDTEGQESAESADGDEVPDQTADGEAMWVHCHNDEDCDYLDEFCRVGVCDTETFECKHMAANEGQPCTLEDPCVLSGKCDSGTCIPTSFKDCNDNNDCTIDTCLDGVCLHSQDNVIWEVSPEEPQDASAVEGDPADPASFVFSIANNASVARTVEVVESDADCVPKDYAWLAVEQGEVSIEAASEALVIAKVDALAVAAPGAYTGYLCFVNKCGEPGQQVREVVLTITPKMKVPPQAVIAVKPLAGPAPLFVEFDAKGSSDPDGTIVAYEWDFESDGKPDNTGVTASHVYQAAGNFKVTLKVKDNDGLFATATATITVTAPILKKLFEETFDTNPFSTGRWTVLYGDCATPKPGTVKYYTEGDACGATPGYVYREYEGTRCLVYSGPPFTTQGYKNLALTFYYRLEGGHISVSVRKNGVWTSALTEVSGSNMSSWAKKVVPLDGTITGIRFLLGSGYDYTRRLDCISITGELACSPTVAITAHPQPVSTCKGTDVTFEVTATGSNLKYQWTRNGVPLADGNGVEGAHTPKLKLLSVDEADAGQYACAVVGDCGAAQSSAAQLVVASGPTITTQPASTSVCPGDSVSLTVKATGTGGLAYRWSKDGVPLEEGPRVTGSTTETLTLKEADDSTVGAYACAVSDECGTTVSGTASVDIECAPPTVIKQPVSQTVTVGSDVTFAVQAQGPGNLKYQWQKDGQDLVDGGSVSGVTTSTLKLANVQLQDAGGYRCLVSNAGGTVESQTAQLSVVEELIGVSKSGHYITYNGQPLLLIGDSGTQCVMQNANLNYRAWVDDCAARGIRAIHIWSFLAPRQTQDGSVVEERYGYVYPGLTPWARRTSGPNAKDGLKQWDLLKFDEGADGDPKHYWPRLRDLCSYAKSRNMMVGITVFFGWPKHNDDWEYHPFNVKNGGHLTDNDAVTQIYSPGVEVLNQAWSSSWPATKKTQWLWERFAQKLIDDTDPIGNVFFVFMDEHSYSEGNCGNHFLQFFQKRGQVWVDLDSRRTGVDFVYSGTDDSTD